MVCNAARASYVYTLKHVASQRCIGLVVGAPNGHSAGLLTKCVGEGLEFAACTPTEGDAVCDSLCGCGYQNEDPLKAKTVAFRHISTGKFISLGGGSAFVAEAAGERVQSQIHNTWMIL